MPPPCLQIVFQEYTSNSSNNNNNKIESAVRPIGTNRFLLLTGEFNMIIRVLYLPCLFVVTRPFFLYR